MRENSYHSYVGEAVTEVWDIGKILHYLYGRDFTWMKDCSGLHHFFIERILPTT